LEVEVTLQLIGLIFSSAKGHGEMQEQKLNTWAASQMQGPSL